MAKEGLSERKVLKTLTPAVVHLVPPEVTTAAVRLIVTPKGSPDTYVAEGILHVPPKATSNTRGNFPPVPTKDIVGEVEQRVASAVLMLAPENVRSIEYDLQVLVEGEDYGVRGSTDAMTDQ